MDTTLRDGEQTPDVSYTPAEKLQIARVLLGDVRVDRIEIAQTRVSEGERLAARRVAAWARKEGVAERVEIMGYCDGDLSVQWIKGVGGRVMNLLTKGSEKHCREQLRQTPEQHRRRVQETILAAHKARVAVNVYLEDWSNGVRDSFDYVFAMVQALRELPVERIYLPDTLGAFAPDETARYVGLMTDAWRDLHFEFHAHNDYGLAVANCLAAVRAGARGVHTSVNGMGERAGNTRLAEVVAALHDHTPYRTGVDEARLVDASRLVETFSGKTVAANSPIVGRDVFTQTGGIHADGDAKGDLYANRLAPKRFGRARQYALGKLSGKASLRPQPEGARHRAVGVASARRCSNASSRSATRRARSPSPTCPTSSPTCCSARSSGRCASRRIASWWIRRDCPKPRSKSACAARRRSRRPAATAATTPSCARSRRP